MDMTINRTPVRHARPASTGPVPADTQEEGMANTITVRVRVLRTFTGAATERGTHARDYVEDDVLDLPAALAALFIANGDAEQTDEDIDDSDDGTAAESTSGDDLAERRDWITHEKTTAKDVAAWLGEQGVSIPRGAKAPDIRALALDVVERLEAGAQPA